MHITTKVSKSGNSWVIRLPKEALALSGLEPGQSLNIEVRPSRLILRKRRQMTDHKLDQAFSDVKSVWDQALNDVWLQVFGPEE